MDQMNGAQWEYVRVKALRMAGLEGHPKADEAWAMAIKNGHEGGVEEILCHLFDLGEIFAPTPEVRFPNA